MFNSDLIGTAGLSQLNIPTARGATTAIVISEMADSAIIKSFARAVKGNVSAGELPRCGEPAGQASRTNQSPLLLL
jgi:hypothetical protein